METSKVGNGWLIRLEKGEKVNASLIQFARNKNLPGGFVHGLGAVKNTELGIYHLHKKEYERKLFAYEAELMNLTGNISWLGSDPAIHVHATIGSPDFQAYGGHLFETEVYVAVELYIEVFNKKIERKYAPEIGLDLLSLCRLP
ncbi:MAG: DNA-binding protein [Planctomycetes bacterium]|nr:DNA-binding protein [Planctomycetota bacterium]